MDGRVIELVTFRLEAGVEADAFRAAAERATGFMRDQPGFLRRRLSCAEDGLWIEHVEWSGMAEARAAAAAIGKDERAREFVRAVDGESVRLIHAELAVADG